MSRVISHQLLEQIGDPRKMSQRNLEQLLSHAEQALTINDKGLTAQVISTFIPKEGVSKMLSAAEVMDDLGDRVSDKSNSVQTVLDKLEEAKILTISENCDYRISTNALAAQLFNKIEADRIVTRKVENFIHERFTIFQEKKLLLTQQDLNYISPYLATISTSKEELAFIQKSKKELEQKKKRQAVIVTLVITALSILSLLASWQYLRANKALKVAEEATLFAQSERKKAEKLSTENAALAREKTAEADSIKLLLAQNEILAKQAQEEARISKQLAMDNKVLAEANRMKAESNAFLAFQNGEYAKEAALRAEESLQLAEKNAALAERETARAAREKELADKNKNLEQIAFSRSLAKQAAQLGYEQAELKALMAHTAYQINENTKGGDVAQQDIYEALYQSVKSINEAKGNDDFNKINNERGSIRSIAFAKNKEGKTFYTISSSGLLKKWTIRKWNDIEKPTYFVETLDKLGTTLNKLALSDDQKWLAVGGELSNVLVYDLKNKNAVPRSLNLHEGKEVFDLTFLPNSNTLLSIGADKTIKRYNLKDDKTSTVATNENLITAFTLSSDPPYILYYGTINGELFENNLAGREQELVITGQTESNKRITAIDAVFYDGRRQLFIGHSNGLLKILEAKAGGWFPTDRSNVVSHFISRFHTAQIADIQHSFGGHYIGITSYDGRSTLWDVYKAINDVYYQPMVFSGDSWATAIGFSDRSAHIVVGYREGDLVFFNPDPRIYAKAICDQVKREFTQDEWDLYIGKTLDPKIYRDTCKE